MTTTPTEPDTTRYEKAFKQGELPALVALATTEQAELADLAHRNHQAAQDARDAAATVRAERDDLLARLGQIKAITEGGS